jgi:hypothetical protein
MNKMVTVAIHDQFIAVFEEACTRLEQARCGAAPIVLLARALHSSDSASPTELAKLWKAELDEPVNRGVIDLAVAMRRKLGPEWHVLYQAEAMSYVPDEGEDEEFNDIESAVEYWEDEFVSFDTRREREQAAVQRWLKRNMKKSA